MKQLLILLLLCPALGFTQEEVRDTFRLKPPPDHKDGISFSIHCDNTDTVFKEIFLSASGNCIFYWGSMRSPSSASFKGDTVTVNSVKNLLTLGLIRTVENCADSVESYRQSCGYTLTTVQDGEVKKYETFPFGNVAANNCVSSQLRTLTRILQELYNKYHFPR